MTGKKAVESDRESCERGHKCTRFDQARLLTRIMKVVDSEVASNAAAVSLGSPQPVTCVLSHNYAMLGLQSRHLLPSIMTFVQSFMKCLRVCLCEVCVEIFLPLGWQSHRVRASRTAGAF